MNHQIEEYQINSRTMFLKPVDYGSKVFTQVVEVEDEYLSPFKPLDIVKKSCDYFGADYESRKKGTRNLTGYNRKIPIAVEPANHIFLFPTTSPQNLDCIWISLVHIEDIHRVGPHQTEIIFQNKQSHIFPVSAGTMEGQRLRTSLLKIKLLQRIENNDRKLFYLSKGLKTSKPSKASESPWEYQDEAKDMT